MRHQTPGPPSKPVPGRGRRTARRAVRGRDDLAKHGLREGWPSDLGSGLENCHGRKFDNGKRGGISTSKLQSEAARPAVLILNNAGSASTIMRRALDVSFQEVVHSV
jgi:hypothetical protein